MRFAPSPGWSSKSALYFLAALVAAALLLFALLANAGSTDAQQSATATRTPMPTSSPAGYTPTPTPFAVATHQTDDVLIDSVYAGIHIIDGLIDAEQREHSETTFPQNGAAPSADQTSGPIWSFPDDMSQDLRAKYRAAFGVMHQLSEQRFGVSANLAELRVVIENSLYGGTCGGANPGTYEDRRVILISHSCRSESGTREVTEIARAVMAHEYFHILHFELENDELTGRLAWLYEGSSEHFKHIYLHHIGATNYIDMRDYLAGVSPAQREALLSWYQSIPSLRTHFGEDNLDLYTIYYLGLLATQYLLEQTGARAHIDFFRRPRGETFGDVFGVPIETFYTSFEAHLAAGLPMPGAPFFTPTPGPTHTPLPATPRPPGPGPVDTPTATPTPGPTHTPAPDICDNGVVVPDPANNPDLVEACAALLKAAPTLAAEPPLNWSTGVNISNWEGVHLDGSPLMVTELRLDYRNLTGKLPAELGSLSNLEGLKLCGNPLTGEIPSELGNLSNLEYLTLYNNQLTGKIPSELGNLSNLEDLFLEGNRLTGRIPPELGNLSNLGDLYLYSNQLTGGIPPELGNLSNLDDLILNNNQLTGEIPLEISNLSNLDDLVLYDNQLTGEIPSELGNLSNLEYLILNNNQLTGEIPSELGNLSNLEYLILNNNQLTGEIPRELGRLYLGALRLDNNQLTGEIPPELNDFSNLRELYISGNQFSGCLPVSLRGIQDNDLQETGLWFCEDDDVRDRVRELEGEMGTVQEQVEALLTQMGTMERLISMLIVRMDALEGALPTATPTAVTP